MNTINPLFIARVFNLWSAKGKIPLDVKQNRTVLLYKKGEESKVENWRPITIGSLWARLYAKLIDLRLREGLALHERQKAFVPLDGCYENSKILQQVLLRMKKAYA